MQVHTIGIDLVKHVFQVHGVEAASGRSRGTEAWAELCAPAHWCKWDQSGKAFRSLGHAGNPDAEREGPATSTERAG